MAIYVWLEVEDVANGMAFVRDLTIDPSVETNASALNVEVVVRGVGLSLDPADLAAEYERSLDEGDDDDE